MPADDPFLARSEIRVFATVEPRRGLFGLFPPATRAELWTGLVFLVSSLLGAAWVLKARSDALALEHDSVNVEGKVLQLWKTQARRGWRHHVEYEYSAPPQINAHILRNQTELPEEHFNGLNEGGPIAVKVCRTNPANHHVAGDRLRIYSDAVATAFALGLLGLLALGGAINLWWWLVCSRSRSATFSSHVG
jgi:hypothetical protein